MWIGNATLTRLWKDRCNEDRTADIINPYGSTKSREKLFVRKRIDVQFNYDKSSIAFNLQMGYWRTQAIYIYWFLIIVIIA